MARKVLKKVGTEENVRNSEPKNETPNPELVSRIKLSFDGDPQFFVNRERGTVACKIRSYINLPLELRLLSNYFIFKHNGRERINYFTTVGVAKLHEGEVWNEELGRRLAEGKAKKQAYTAGFNFINNVLVDVVKDLRSAVEFRASMETLREHEVEHLNELVDGIDVY